MNLLQSHPEWIVIVLAVIGGWLLGRASAPNTKRLRRRLEEAEEAHAATREQASRDLANANRIIRETMAERDAARGTADASTGSEWGEAHDSGRGAALATSATLFGTALPGHGETSIDHDHDSADEGHDEERQPGEGAPQIVEAEDEEGETRIASFAAVPDPGAILPIPIETAPDHDDEGEASLPSEAVEEEGVAEPSDSADTFPEVDDPDEALSDQATTATHPAPEVARQQPVAQSAARPAFPEAGTAEMTEPDPPSSWKTA